MLALWNQCSKDHEEIAPLSIASLSPAQGPAGTMVTITGIGFSTTTTANTVTFNGVPATITLATGNQLIATVPASATTGVVKISTGGKEVSGPVFTVTQPSSLTVTGINPASGPTGIDVTLTGTGFSTTAAQNKVKFNGATAVVKSATATQLVVMVPANATTGTVSVQVADKTVTGSMFTVLSPTAPTLSSVAPTSGKVGATVTLSGTGFSATSSQNIVKFNGTTATVTSAAATSLTVTVPPGATSGDVTVTVNGKTPAGIHFDVTATLTVISYDPASGNAGTPVIITGSGFDSNPSVNVVKFNGVAAQVTEATATTLKVTVPNGATTGPITVGIGADVAEGPVFTVTPLSTLTVTVSTVPLGSATLNLPRGLAIDVSGNLLVADQANNRIMKLTPSGLLVFAGSGSRSLTGPVDGPFATAQFNSPSGISVDENTGDVYVADTQNNVIRKIAAGGPVLMVQTWAGNTNGQGDISDGHGAGPFGVGAGFFYPTGIVKSKNSATWFITDYWSHIIRKMDASANVTTFAGLALNSGSDDGKGKDARFFNPGGITIDENDNVYIGDCVNGSIRKIDAAGNVTTLAKNLGQIYGLVWDGKGSLYATDYTKHKIYKVDSSGTVTTIAGTGTAGYHDGGASTAQFNFPFGLAMDSDGNLYVGDEHNNLIRKITFN
ncbi:NHL repeat-containing protein [Chryseolinea serpens]|uniref:NHL repeat-containing protein n=2 Tax=Chryseolinea serpens TaxID=947013 RepID=A0A1M5NBJ9_9BACT|nr:NHL repeat-containing protein [Chryseolinea serpens]